MMPHNAAPYSPEELAAIEKDGRWSYETVQRLIATVRDRERQITKLERVINDMPGIAAGIEDAIAGRVKHLSCVEGGCERDELQRQLAETETRKALVQLANEAEGFLGMSSIQVHGATNQSVLRLRINEAREALRCGPRAGVAETSKIRGNNES